MNNFLQNFSKVLQMIRLLLPVILFIFVCLLLFATLSQGQDVLLIASQSTKNSVFFIISVSFFAYVNWYSSRLLAYLKADATGQRPERWWFSGFPRVLGYASFTAIQVALIHHPYFVVSNKTMVIVVLLIAQAVIYYLIDRFYQKKQGYKPWSIWVIVPVIVLVIIVSLSLTEKNTIHRNLMIHLLLLWVLQTFFLIWNYIRRRRIHQLDGEKKEVTLFNSIKIITLPKSEMGYFRWFNILALPVIILYLVVIYNAKVARMVMPFNVAMLTIAVLVGFLQLVTMITIWRKVNFHFLLLVLAIIMGFIFNPYELRKIEAETPVYNQRMQLTNYATRWLKARESEINNLDSGKKYPVYFVLSDGGASRSGYWVAGALGRLQSESGGKFSKHLLCLSGASGGSVGNGVFYTLLDSAAKTGAPAIDFNEGRNFLKNDFLSSTLAHMLGADYFRYFVGGYILPIDRGEALEVSMENPKGDHFMGHLFNREYKDYITSFNTNAEKLPLFFINTTRVKDGNPGVVGNIVLDSSYTSRIDVLSLLDKGQNNKPFGSVHFSSTVVLGARFPYLSPAADLGDQYFVDGGYFDNSGAGVVMETLVFLNNLLEEPEYSQYKGKLQYNIIHLSNSER
ncbi:MAG TPA: hypothetical protein VEC12_05920, partial [Bacteroidia bacterium]|nr:hypothetical protein [Bacteroidia bacterium]